MKKLVLASVILTLGGMVVFTIPDLANPFTAGGLLLLIISLFLVGGGKTEVTFGDWLGDAFRWLVNAVATVVMGGIVILSFVWVVISSFAPQGLLNLDRYSGGQSATFVVLAQNGSPVEGFSVSVIKTKMTDRYGNIHQVLNGRSCNTGSDGSCAIDHLPSGNYLVLNIEEDAGIGSIYVANRFCPQEFAVGAATKVFIQANIVRRGDWNFQPVQAACQTQTD